MLTVQCTGRAQKRRAPVTADVERLIDWMGSDCQGGDRPLWVASCRWYDDKADVRGRAVAIAAMSLE